MIDIQGMYKKFGKRYILDDLNLYLAKDKVHGVVGDNGSGKTTLFHCIYGLIKDYKGKISSSEFVSIRKNTGYLPAELYFYPRLKGKEYLKFCLKARNIKDDKIKEFNQIFELPLDKYVEDYSTGMKKKIALMALVMLNYSFLILDEPFNGLDITMTILLKEIIKILKKERKTIVVTSHILDTLTDTCDEIHHLYQGKIQRSYEKYEFSNIEDDVRDNLLFDKIKLFESTIKT